MAVHKPAGFENWSRGQRRQWMARWGQVNEVGKVDDYTKTKSGAKNTAAPNDNPVVRHQPEPATGPGVSPADETEKQEAKRLAAEAAAEKKRDEKLALAREKRAEGAVKSDEWDLTKEQRARKRASRAVDAESR